MTARATDASATPAVTAVIPTYNRASDLERSLAHLARQSMHDMRVVVVDNSSTDGTRELVLGLMPAWQGRLEYIRREPNGPASARNTGLVVTKTPFVLFLDSDIDLPPNWVERALAHFANDRALGAAGGYILYGFASGYVNAYGGDLGWTGLAWDVDEGTPLDASKGPARRIWINCSAMLARTDAVRDAGGFDDAFFYGHEDTDLGWRLNLIGYHVAVYPDLRAIHNVGADPGSAHPQIVFHACKNRLRSMLRNASAANLAVMLPAYTMYTLADLVARGPRAAKIRALTWNFAHLGQTLALRRALQKKRAISDAEIFGYGSRRWLPPTALRGRRRRPLRDPVGPESSRPSRSDTDDRI